MDHNKSINTDTNITKDDLFFKVKNGDNGLDEVFVYCVILDKDETTKSKFFRRVIGSIGNPFFMISHEMTQDCLFDWVDTILEFIVDRITTISNKTGYKLLKTGYKNIFFWTDDNIDYDLSDASMAELSKEIITYLDFG